MNRSTPPPLPDPASLLAELEPLRHAHQAHRLALLGRDAQDDPGLGALLRGLGDDAWAWRLRLVAATAARHRQHVLDALRSPHGSVRSMASRRLRVVGIDASQLLEALAVLPVRDRRTLLRCVGHDGLPGGTALFGACIDAVRDRYGTYEAALLLPKCSTETVGELLPALEPGLRMDQSMRGGWWRLASHHEAVVLAYARRVLARGATGEKMTWDGLSHGLQILSRRDPDEVLALLREGAELQGLVPVPDHVLAELLRLRPKRTLGWMLDFLSREAFTHRLYLLGSMLHGCDDTTLRRVSGRLMDNLHTHARLLAMLPSSRRAVAYAARSGDGEWIRSAAFTRVLDLLPEAVRVAEARTSLELGAGRDDPDLRRSLVDRLPLDERWDTLLRATDADSPELRTTAWVRLMKSIERSHGDGAMDRLLEVLPVLLAEPDEERAPALAVLAASLGSRLTGTALQRLMPLVHDATAKGANAQPTRDALAGAFRAAWVDAEARGDGARIALALNALEPLSAAGATRWLHDLHACLRPGAERHAVEALAPLLDADARRGRHGLLLSLVDGLGSRARRVDALQDRLRRVALDGSANDARRAIPAWLIGSRAIDARIAELLAVDPSAVRLPAVLERLATRRQDLVDEYVTRLARGGRFELERGCGGPPIVTCRTLGWSPRLLSRYTEALRSAALAALPDMERKGTTVRR